MKCTNKPYGITKDEYDRILNRMSVFHKETGTKKSLHVTLISARGLKEIALMLGWAYDN